MSKSIKKVLLGVTWLLIFSFVLAACGSSDSTTDGSGSSAPANPSASGPAEAGPADSSGAENSGGEDDYHVLNILCGAQQVTLDPLEASTGSSTIVNRSIYASLWRYYSDDSSALVYDLAESYEWLNDEQTELKIVLRDTAWSDGTPVTAEDVLWCLEYYLNTNMATQVGNIDFEASYAEDARTPVLVLTSASPLTVENLADLSILSKAVYEDGGQERMGSDPLFDGAYMVTEFETGEPIVLKKNPHYYDFENVYYDEVVLTCINDENTRYLTFKGGGYDIMSVQTQDYIDYIRDGQVENSHIQRTQMQAHVYMAFNTFEFPQFADVNVRAAVAHAVDWETLITTICGGDVTMATSCLLPHSNWAYVNTGVYSYDPDLARQYLEKAGYGEGEFSFTCRIADEDFNSELCESMQAYLADVGIVMEISTADSPTVRSEMRGNEVQFGISKAIGSSDPAGITRSRLSSTSPNLYHMVSIPELGDTYLQDLLDGAATSIESNEVRGETYQEIQELMFENYACYPLYETSNCYGASDAMGDFSAACETWEGAIVCGRLTNDLVASW